MSAFETTSACTTDGVAVVEPAAGAIVSGEASKVAVRADSSGTNTHPYKVEILVDNYPIGLAAQVDSLHWAFKWDTTKYNNGTHYISARAYYDSTASTCSSATIGISVQNATATRSPSSLHVTIKPDAWEGPVNVSAPFVAQTVLKYTDGSLEDVTAGASYKWATSLGSINFAKNAATYYSGPNAGDGYINVHAAYSGLSAGNKARVKVLSSAEATTSGYPEPTSTTATVAPPPPDPALTDCLKKALGLERFKAINSGTSRPTMAEYDRMRSCFVQRQNILPANFAPVAPDQVKHLPGRSTKLKVNAPVTKKIKNAEGADVPVLVISGKAIPDSQVFVYVFSEPLVLTTKADSEGNWTYTLESPLQPGEHEVYVTVEEEPGQFVRSAPRLVSIARAAATETNPQGNNLEIDPGILGSELLYIALSVILVVFGIRAAFVIRRGGLAPAKKKR